MCGVRSCSGESHGLIPNLRFRHRVTDKAFFSDLDGCEERPSWMVA
jgi:hypothetical protein